MSPDRLPEWLQPFKNEWHTASGLRKLLQLNGRAFSPWFDEVRGRMRSVQTPRPGDKVSTRYLVKQVWAAARAHGYEVLPADKSTPPAEAIRALETRNYALTYELIHRRSEVLQLQQKLADMTKAGADYERFSWLAFALTEPRPMPGVYFLLSAEQVVTYVGQSINVLSRMSGHAEKAFHAVRMVHVADKTERLQLEARMIRLLQPADNIQGLRRAA